MIVCPDSGFFFMHIPKNGGSSVRDQIQAFDCFDGAFRGTKEHPALGLYDSGHVPLAMLKEHFSEAFNVISALDGYAILRDPIDRFASGLAQRFRMIHQRRPDKVSRAEVSAEIDLVIAELTQTDRPISRGFSFFVRQVEFVDLDGTRFVKNLFRLSDTGLLIRELGERLGKPLVEDFHSNKTVTFRHDWLARPVIAAKDFIKSHASARTADLLRRVALKALTTPSVSAISEQVEKSEELRSFIRDYYREDFELLEQFPPRPPQD